MAGTVAGNVEPRFYVVEALLTEDYKVRTRFQFRKRQNLTRLDTTHRNSTFAVFLVLLTRPHAE